MSNTLKFGAGKWAAKSGSVLAYNDENNNFKPLPFTFTRASNATRVNESGLIENVASGVPRIDFLDNADGHLLLEPSRTNLVTYSEKLENWIATSTTVATNVLVSPDGTQNAGTIVINNSSSRVSLGTSAGAGTYTVSVYAKLVSGSGNVRIVLVVDGANVSFIFTPTSEWVKYTYTVTAVTGITTIQLRGSSGTSTVSFWGAQLEAGSYPTSYIPTSGATATRVDEIVGQTPVSGIVGQTEGAFFVEFEDLNYSYTSIARIIAFSDGTSTNRIYLAQLASGAMYLISTSGCEIQESAPSGRRGVLKAAVSYSLNNYKLYVNGVLIGTDTSATVSVCNRFYLGGENGLSTGVYKPYKEVKVFNTALSDAELIALTQ